MPSLPVEPVSGAPPDLNPESTIESRPATIIDEAIPESSTSSQAPQSEPHTSPSPPAVSSSSESSTTLPANTSILESSTSTPEGHGDSALSSDTSERLNLYCPCNSLTGDLDKSDLEQNFLDDLDIPYYHVDSRFSNPRLGHLDHKCFGKPPGLDILTPADLTSDYSWAQEVIDALNPALPAVPGTSETQVDLLLPADLMPGPSNTQDTLKSFTIYKTLFPELRAMVIAAEMNVPRLMCSHVQLARKEHPRNYSAQPHTLPGLLWVDKETRAEVLKHVILSAPTATGYRTYPWSYINPLYDTVFDGHVEWNNIPTNSEAPGLRSLALGIHYNQWLKPTFNSDPDSITYTENLMNQLSNKLNGLPDLEEVIFVRTIPQFILELLKAEETPRLARHECGFFSKGHDDIEQWLEIANRYRSEGIDPAAGEVEQLVKRIVDEDDKMEAEVEARGRTAYIYTEQRNPKEILKFFVDSLMRIQKENFPETKLPKFSLAYIDDVELRRTCDCRNGFWHGHHIFEDQ